MLRSESPVVQPRLSIRMRRAASLGAVALAALAPADSRALVADCEDGSVVLATRWEDVHCAGAVEVAPGATPRLGAARRLEAPGWREARRRREEQRELDLESQIDRARTLLGRQRTSLAPSPTAWPDSTPFELSESEYDALSRFMELSQAGVAAGGAREDLRHARVRLAYSRAFEAKLRARLAGAGQAGRGSVLVFLIAPHGARLGEPPHFGQGGATFRPRATDPTQLGRIVRKGDPSREPALRLGYVVLPTSFELARPVVLFWGDMVEVAQLLP